jgi:ATP-dependent Clp protease ATP-binding subunit ClpC
MPDISIGLEFAWQIAAAEAAGGRHEFIAPAHLFVGLCSLEKALHPELQRQLRLPDDAAAALRAEWEALSQLLAQFGIEPTIRRELRERIGEGSFADESRRKVSRSPASKAAFARAAELAKDAPAVTTFHLLAALLESEDGFVVALLREKGVNIPTLQSAALAAEIPKPKTQNLLSLYGKDLTLLAREEKVHECIGRRDEILRVIQTLSRDTKNNPLLIGEAGVGKTAIVEGLAWRVANNKDPALAGKRIVQLNVADLVAGTKYRGEFEERMQGILGEVAQSPDVILFIDEIHTLIGAGGASGALDAANIIKPALARGELRCIGATTVDEYRKHIEKDAALERRFQPIKVEEPTEDETEQILKEGYHERFQTKHQVTIDAAALHAAVTLSARYLTNLRLPDKAIDLLDEACARVVVPALSLPPEGGTTSGGGMVTAETVAEVLAQWTGIPVAQMTEDERERLTRMAEALKQRVVGQDAACEAVAQAVQRARAGLKPTGRPVGVLLFVGPTGVGKTELAKATAAFLFGSERAMLRFDMSEYQEKHTVSRLIGSPPGYEGHDEGGQLTNALHLTPYRVVLLDEIEKAHADVLNLFLQMFDDGRLTDNHGRTADATNALFILTSNLLTEEERRIGFRARGELSSALIKHGLRPELVNRFDEVLVFQPLQSQHAAAIVRLMLNDLAQRLKAQKVGLDVRDAALAHLCREGIDATSGARHLRRLIEQLVENEIAGRILRQQVKPHHVVIVDVKDGELTFEVVGEDTI